MKRIFFLSMAIFTVFINSLYAFDYVIGETLYPYSTKSALASKGDSYIDPVYHTTMTRVSKTSVDRSSEFGTGIGYSTWNPLSNDGTHILLYGLAGYSAAQGYTVYNTVDNSYNATMTGYLRNYAGWWNGEDPEVRWDVSGSHNLWVYYRKDMHLRYVDLSDGSDHLVHDFAVDFPQYAFGYYIYSREVSPRSSDQRYWAFEIKPSTLPIVSRVLVYDKQTNTVLTSRVVGEFIYGTHVSRSGNYIAILNQYTGTGTDFDGTHIHPINDLSGPGYKVCTQAPHLTWAYDAQGNECVFFMDNDYISFVVASTGVRYDLYEQSVMGWDVNCLHSAPWDYSKRGWGFISTYVDSTLNNDHWAYNQIFAIELDENKWISHQTNHSGYPGTDSPTVKLPKIWRIAFTQNYVNMSHYYYQQPNATISPDGSKIWFGCNWRNDLVGTDVYRIDLPATWWEDLGENPYVDGCVPANYAIGIDKNTNIVAHIKDPIEGVDMSSIIMKVNGHIVTPVITGTIYDCIMTYTPVAAFSDGQVINVTLSAQDLDVPVNVMSQFNYSFTIGVPVSKSVTSNSSGAGGGGGGCFIATAVYGSKMAKETKVFIKFRDKFMLTNKAGRSLVGFYYKISPPIAQYIEKRAWARSIVRSALEPVLWLAKRTIDSQEN
jgi:hypothetical protein